MVQSSAGFSENCCFPASKTISEPGSRPVSHLQRQFPDSSPTVPRQFPDSSPTVSVPASHSLRHVFHCVLFVFVGIPNKIIWFHKYSHTYQPVCMVSLEICIHFRTPSTKNAYKTSELAATGRSIRRQFPDSSPTVRILPSRCRSLAAADDAVKNAVVDV